MKVKSIKDEPPPKDQEVLLLLNLQDYGRVGDVNGYFEGASTEIDGVEYKYTHWMDVPEVPEYVPTEEEIQEHIAVRNKVDVTVVEAIWDEVECRLKEMGL